MATASGDPGALLRIFWNFKSKNGAFCALLCIDFVHFYALVLKLNAVFLYMQKITTETVSNHIRKTVTKLILYVFFQRQEPESTAIVCIGSAGE